MHGGSSVKFFHEKTSPVPTSAVSGFRDTSDGTRRECRRPDGPGQSSHAQPQINVGLPDLAGQLARGEQRPRSFVSGLREQLLRWPLLDHHTLIHDDNAVSDLPSESHLMGHDHHGGPCRADAADRL